MKGKRKIVVSFFLLFDPLENDLYTRGYYWIFSSIKKDSLLYLLRNYLGMSFS